MRIQVLMDPNASHAYKNHEELRIRFLIELCLIRVFIEWIWIRNNLFFNKLFSSYWFMIRIMRIQVLMDPNAAHAYKNHEELSDPIFNWTVLYPGCYWMDLDPQQLI